MQNRAIPRNSRGANRLLRTLGRTTLRSVRPETCARRLAAAMPPIALALCSPEANPGRQLGNPHLVRTSRRPAPEPAAPAAGVPGKRLSELPLRFDVNSGQLAAGVRFAAHSDGYEVGLTATGALIEPIRRPGPVRSPALRRPASATEPPRVSTSRSTTIRIDILKIDPGAALEGLEPLPGKSN